MSVVRYLKTQGYVNCCDVCELHDLMEKIECTGFISAILCSNTKKKLFLKRLITGNEKGIGTKNILEKTMSHH